MGVPQIGLLGRNLSAAVGQTLGDHALTCNLCPAYAVSVNLQGAISQQHGRREADTRAMYSPLAQHILNITGIRPT